MFDQIYQQALDVIRNSDEEDYKQLLSLDNDAIFSFNNKRISQAILDELVDNYFCSELNEWGFDFRKGRSEITCILFGRKLYLYRPLACLLKTPINILSNSDIRDLRYMLKISRRPVNITPTWDRILQ